MRLLQKFLHCHERFQVLVVAPYRRVLMFASLVGTAEKPCPDTNLLVGLNINHRESRFVIAIFVGTNESMPSCLARAFSVVPAGLVRVQTHQRLRVGPQSFAASRLGQIELCPHDSTLWKNEPTLVYLSSTKAVILFPSAIRCRQLT